MTDVFLSVLRMALTSIPVICVIFIIRAVTGRRMPNSFHYALWLILMLRLLAPISLPGGLGILDAPVRQIETTVFQQTPADNSEHIPGRTTQEQVQPAIDQQTKPDAADGAVNPPASPRPVTFIEVCAWVWLAGVLLTLTYFIAAFCSIRRRIRSTSVPWEAPSGILPEDMLFRKRLLLKCCTGFDSPFVFGLKRPVVVLPYNVLHELDFCDIKLIIRHELAHVRRRDVLALHISSLLRCVYWFDPFVHLALSAMKADQEIACDASVAKRLFLSERKSYANVLLAVASGAAKRASVGISEFGKGNTKRRVGEIMSKKKYAPLTAVITAFIVLAVGVFVLTISAKANAGKPGAAVAGVAPAPTATLPAANIPASPSPAPADVDTFAAAEDFNAVAKEGFSGDPYALLTVALDGGYAEKKYPGTWISHLTTGDIDGDGNEDIVLYLEFLGSSGYGVGEAHVLRAQGSELSEYPDNFIQNPAVGLKCPQSYAPSNEGTFRALIGAGVVNTGGRDLLRVTHWLMDSGDDTVQYTDAFFNGEGWQIEDSGLLSGEQYLAQKKSEAISDETPAFYREGVQNAELTFVLNSGNPASDKRDPDKQYYFDSENEILMPTLRESAQAALRQLYDMTGFNVQKCYVLSTGNTLFFSMDKNDFDFGSFFSYSINPMLSSAEGGLYPWSLFISYKNDMAASPIDAAGIAAPENPERMSDDEIAKWYYENSSFGDRRSVVGTEADHGGFIRLILENGDFYEATLSSARMIQSLCGPYSKGYEH